MFMQLGHKDRSRTHKFLTHDSFHAFSSRPERPRPLYVDSGQRQEQGQTGEGASSQDTWTLLQAAGLVFKL